jgi:hypothetical protein
MTLAQASGALALLDVDFRATSCAGELSDPACPPSADCCACCATAPGARAVGAADVPLQPFVLVAQVRVLETEGRPFRDALREASLGRVRPKILTASTAILGLLPILVLRLHGTEIERPLAVVMKGGLVTSTLFTLLALPAFLLWIEPSAPTGSARRTPSA